MIFREMFHVKHLPTWVFISQKSTIFCLKIKYEIQYFDKKKQMFHVKHLKKSLTTIVLMKDMGENILKEILKNETIKKQEYFKVKQLDNNNNVVAIFDSCEQASKIFGRHVWDCCNGKRKTCKGYKFEYMIHTEQS